MANLDASYSNQIFRKDFPIILACNRHLATLLPVRLAYNASGYTAGQVLAQNSATLLFQNYVNGGASGTGTAKCVLFQSIDASEFPSATGTAMEQGVFGGEVYDNLLIDADSTAKTDLNGRTFSDSSGTAIFKF